MPTQYSANIASLESRVSELKGAVSAGSIEGAPRLVTSTGDGGVVAVTTVPGVSASTGGVSGGSTVASSGRTGSTTMLTGTNTKSTTGMSGSATTQDVASTTTRSSSGFAMATEIPAAIMGVAGLFGLVAAL